MRVDAADLEGVILIRPDVREDSRGFFLESWHHDRYRAAGIDVEFVQDNHAQSRIGVLRGLHAQHPIDQGKLVRAIRGSIFDVAVDIRRGSSSFGSWFGVHLSTDNHQQIYIPPGFAHGYCVLSDVAEIEYKCTDYYSPENELTILWSDPDIGIEWPVDHPILSEKDAAAPTLKELGDRLPTS